MSERVLFVGQDRGGSGKTFTAAALVVGVCARATPVRVVEYEVSPRIATILGGLVPVDYRSTTIDRESKGYKEAALKFWDRLLESDLTANGGGAVFDTAANLLSDALSGVSRLNEKGGEMDLAKRDDIGFVIPMTVDRFAMEATPALVSDIREVFEASPIWVVENEREGEFCKAGDYYKKCRERLERAGVRFVTLPAPDPMILPNRLASLRLDALMSMTRPQIGEMFGLGLADAIRAHKAAAKFASSVLDALAPIVSWYAEGAPSFRSAAEAAD